MIFDEKKRTLLLKEYRTLSATDRKALRLLSVIYFPVDVDSFQAVARTAGFREMADASPDAVKKRFTRWKKAKLVVSDTRQWGDAWTPAPLVREPLAREAVRDGEYGPFDKAFMVHAEKFPRTFPYRYGFGTGNPSYNSGTGWFRDMRTAFYTGDTALMHAALSVHRVAPDYAVDGFVLKGFKNPQPEIVFLCNPIDERLILGLPEEIGVEVLLRATAFFAPSDDEYEIVNRLFVAYFEKHPSNPAMARFVAEGMLASGKIGEAADIVSPSHVGRNPETAALLALLDIVRGRPDAALSTYEEGLKGLRKAYKKKKRVAYSSWCGVFYPILLARAASEAGEEEAKKLEKKFRDYIDSEASHDNFSGRRNTFVLLGPLLSRDDRARLITHENAEKLMPSASATDGLAFILTLIWIAPENAREYDYFIRDYCEKMLRTNRAFFAAEALSVLRDVAPDEAKKFPAVPEPEFPLKNLLAHKPEWQRSLDELKKIAASESTRAAVVPDSAGDARVAWEVSWRANDEKRAYAIEIAPLEQKMQAKGWSKGRKISLERLLKNPDSVKGLSERDRRAMSAISGSYRYSYSNIAYVMDTVPALKALSGHPHLVDGDGAAVEILVEEPQIHTAADGDSFVFEMRPKPDEADLARGAAILEDAPCVLRLVPFGERHVQIARILGANGLRVPASAREDVLRVIGGLASVATIHSDIEGAETGTTAVEPDAGLYVQIQPRGDALDIEAVTRPLGPKSVPCRPGVGEAGIFGMRDGASASTTRDLEAEATVLRGFRECCPALARASELSANKWQTTDAETSFEFLTQLQDIADHVTIEWPSGGRRTVKRLDPGAVSLTASALGNRDWFEVSGEIRVDENLVLPLKELLGLMDGAKGRFVRIDGDTFLALTNDFRRRLDELRALGEARGDGVRVHPSAIPLLSGFVDGAGDFQTDEAWKARAAKIDEAAALVPQVPSTLRGELRDYQREGFEWIARLAHWTTGACLADDMGLGKTIQALAFLVARAPQGPSLVVAPTSVCPNWLEEAARFAPTLAMKEFRHGDRRETVESLGPMDVLVASYGLLQSESELLAGVAWNAIVLDEAQSIKNMSTKRSAAAMKLDAGFKLITTGTPIENNLSELWNLFRFIAPHYLGSHESFNRKFASAVAGENGAGARRRLRRIISPFLLRRTKEQVLTELPPKTEVTLRVELYPEERTLYEALRRRAVEEIEAGREDGGDIRFTILAQLTKLRLACCNSALALPEGGEGFRSAKLDAYAEIVSDLRSGGHKALVFSQFVSHLSILKKYLEENDVPFQYLDGSTPAEERKKRVDAFQNGNGDVFLISLKAGGTGLNLTAADYVVHMDPWWNPAVETQASDRTHRIGQERPVTIYRIVAKDTVEEKITDLHAWKRELAESLLDGASTPAKFSADEMMALIRGAG